MEKDTMALLYLTVGLAICFWVAVSFWKYAHFLYNGLDLAIYAQVVWNTSQGRWFAMSIHPQLYLGDHFEPYILVLALFYKNWADPRTLLIIQSIVVNAAALPLFFLAKNIFQKTATIRFPQALALLVTFTYLLSPFVANAVLFEFHMLPFVLLPFFCALYFAEQNRYWLAMACLAGTLLVREDASFLVALFGLAVVILFPSLREKKWRWILPPLAVSMLFFFVATIIVSHYSPTNDYKYIGFYTDLQGNLFDTVWFMVTHPGPILARLLRIQHIIALAGLLMPVGFLAVFAPSAILLGVLPMLQYAFPSASSEQVLVLHYGVMFLPWLFVGTIFGLRNISSYDGARGTFLRMGWPAGWPFQFSILVLAASAIYGGATLGQLRFVDTTRGLGQSGASTKEAMRYAVAQINEHETVITPNAIAPKVANRQFLYPHVYVRRGTQQLSDDPYVVPGPVDAMIIAQEDIHMPVLIWKDGVARSISFATSAAYVQQTIIEKGLQFAWQRDGVALWRNNVAPQSVPLIEERALQGGGSELSPGLRVQATAPILNNLIDLNVSFDVLQAQTETKILLVEFLDSTGSIIGSHRFHPGWGIQAMEQWPVNRNMLARFTLTKLARAETLSLSLVAGNKTSTDATGRAVITLPIK